MSTDFIARFNPYQIKVADVHALTVGREMLLAKVLGTIENNLQSPAAPNQHLLLSGQRGMGKSFLLRLLEIELAERDDLHMVILPEEQPNIFSPEGLLLEIANRLGETPLQANVALWEGDGDENWQAALNHIWERKALLPGSPLLVVAVENIDQLLNQAFDELGQSYLRKLLEHEPRLMLIASCLNDDVDQDYDQRLFQAFRHLPLTPWGQKEHVAYLKKRAELAGVPFGAEAAHKIRAYSQFTGGSPRIAMVLADLLLGKSDAKETAVNLQTLVDSLTDYYLDLLGRIPTNSRKLFDALLRLGEPCSQSGLAARVGATQSRISRAFSWLRDHRYVQEEPRIKGRKEQLYRATDRLMVQFYRMRYLQQDSRRNALASMADFLADFYSFKEQRREASTLLEQGAPEDARLFAELALRGVGVSTERLNIEPPERMVKLLSLAEYTDKVEWRDYEDDKALRKDYEDALTLLRACDRHQPAITGEAMAELLNSSFGLTVPTKLQTARLCLSEQGTLKKWKELKVFLDMKRERITERLKENPETMKRLVQQRSLDRDYPRTSAEAGELESVAKEAMDKEGWADALAAHREALALRKKQGDAEQQALNLGHIGWSLDEMDRHEEALAAYREALALCKEQGDAEQQAWNLGQIGWSLDELNRHEEALTAHREAYALYQEQDNAEQQAWNLGRIGCNLKKLNRHEEALAAHREALTLYQEQANTEQQAWNLGRIGSSLNELERHEEALAAYREALALCKEQGDAEQQAWDLGQIGWSLDELNRHEEALAAHREAYALYQEQDNAEQQAWKLGRIGWNLNKLDRHEEALAAHREALTLYQEQANTEQQAWSLEQICWSLNKSNRHEEALAAHREALTLYKEQGNATKQAWSLGQIARIHWIRDEHEQAWKLLQEFSSTIEDDTAHYLALQQIGDGVVDIAKRNGRAAGFAAGSQLFRELKRQEQWFDPERGLRVLMLDFLEMKLEIELIRDLCTEAVEILGLQVTTITESISLTLEYLENGCSQDWLQRLDPDMATTVETLASEAGINVSMGSDSIDSYSPT
ncbi:MAG: tetratricopeptide repeat protein [Sedimenticola sp.]